MTTTQLISVVAKKAKIPESDVKKMVNTIAKQILSAKGDKLTIASSGTISLKRKEARRHGHGSLRSGGLNVKRGAKTGRFVHVTDPASAKKILKTLKIPPKLAIYEKLKD